MTINATKQILTIISWQEDGQKHPARNTTLHEIAKQMFNTDKTLKIGDTYETESGDKIQITDIPIKLLASMEKIIGVQILAWKLINKLKKEILVIYF